MPWSRLYTSRFLSEDYRKEKWFINFWWPQRKKSWIPFREVKYKECKLFISLTLMFKGVRHAKFLVVKKLCYWILSNILVLYNITEGHPELVYVMKQWIQEKLNVFSSRILRINCWHYQTGSKVDTEDWTAATWSPLF